MTVYVCLPCEEFFTVPANASDKVDVCPYCGDAEVEYRPFTEIAKGPK